MTRKRLPLIALLMLLTVAMSMVMAACNRGDDLAADTLGGSVLQVDDLPTTLGRGFPQGTLMEDTTLTSLDAGEMAPDFQLVLADGSYLSLSDLQGRPVMINFWATWCPPCRVEMPDIIEQYNEHGDDLVVLAINTREGMDLVEPFTQEFGITMPVVLDQHGEIMRLYQVRSMPTTFFIGRDGRISMKWIGLMSPDVIDSFLKIIL
jgi:thiol-disulfide isomerase/thioredoxin